MQGAYTSQKRILFFLLDGFFLKVFFLITFLLLNLQKQRYQSS